MLRSFLGCRHSLQTCTEIGERRFSIARPGEFAIPAVELLQIGTAHC